jgi:hypothetical protein
MDTERRRQQLAAVAQAAVRATTVWRWHYVCADGETFSAIAPTEPGAFRVLNAVRPGMLARFDGVTACPIETRAAFLRNAGIASPTVDV